MELFSSGGDTHTTDVSKRDVHLTTRAGCSITPCARGTAVVPPGIPLENVGQQPGAAPKRFIILTAATGYEKPQAGRPGVPPPA